MCFISWFIQALVLSPCTRRTTTVGEIVNLMAVDALKVHDFCMFFHEFWTCLLSLGIALGMLYYVIGLSSLASLCLFMLILPLNAGVFGKKFATYQV